MVKTVIYCLIHVLIVVSKCVCALLMITLIELRKIFTNKIWLLLEREKNDCLQAFKKIRAIDYDQTLKNKLPVVIVTV